MEELYFIVKKLEPLSDDYIWWIYIGQTIFDITDGSNEGLRLWDDFSRSSPLYKVDECDGKWNDMRGGNKTIATLYYILTTQIKP